MLGQCRHMTERQYRCKCRNRAQQEQNRTEHRKMHEPDCTRQHPEATGDGGATLTAGSGSRSAGWIRRVHDNPRLASIDHVSATVGLILMVNASALSTADPGQETAPARHDILPIPGPPRGRFERTDATTLVHRISADHPVLDAAKSVRSPALDVTATAYTDVGGTVGMPILALTATIVLALRRRSWTPVILIVIAAAGSLLMTIAGKQLIGRTRPALTDAIPPYEHSASFPSGHSLNSVVIAGIVAYLVILRLKSSRSRILAVILAAAFAATMGLSRVYLGHHWLTDVLAAWALGAAWLALVITAHRLYLTARTHRAEKPVGSPPEE
jgi:membrane-associated phospholipid phosphatase